MNVCKICLREFNSLRSLSVHIVVTHKIKPSEYYDKYLKKDNDGICYCGKKCNFSNIRDGYYEYCSVKCVSNSIKVKDQKIQSSINHYGVINPLQSKEVQQKIKTTCFHKYGVDNIFKDTNKIKKSYLKKFGVSSPLQLKEIQNRIKQTCLTKYGVENPSQLKEIKEKKIQTSLKNCGYEYWSKSPSGKQFFRYSMLEQVRLQYSLKEVPTPRIGNQEFPFFDELQKHTRFTILKSKPIIGYFPDGHIPELKLFIEFYEGFHFEDKTEMTILKQKDVDRELELASLGYIIFRVSEKDWKENKELVINRFKDIL